MIILKKLKKLEETKIISIGVNKNIANNIWSKETALGKILNILTLLLGVGVILLLFLNWKLAILLFLGIGAYVIIIQKIACMWLRIRVLSDISFFNHLYELSVITILDRYESLVIRYPENWILLTGSIYDKQYSHEKK